MTTPLPTLVPISGRERIASIDILRGFALLGILVMNVQSFGLIEAAYMNPTAYGSLEGGNYWAWLVSHLFADQKFMTLFSTLFGVGVAIMTERADARGGASFGVHGRRMLWLAAFGLMHAHLLWYGDILWMYAWCGLFVYFLRKIRPSLLVAIAIPLIIIPSALFMLFGWSMVFAPPEVIEEQTRQWAPLAAEIQAELDVYRGGWLGQMSQRVPTAIMFETFMLVLIGPRVLGLMCIGIALYRWRIVTAARSARFYAVMAAAGLAIGLAITGYGVVFNTERDFAFPDSMFFGFNFNYWGSLFAAYGYIGVVMLLCRIDAARRLLAPLGAVGRMALTNYLAHTVICTTIFYGHGFGYFGSLSRVELLVVVFAVWIAQLIWSPLWLRWFRFGPMEWVWRSLTYLRPQPMRRAVSSSSPAP